MSAPEKYRPSNGTEGHGFQAAYCDRCTKDSENSPCQILGATMLYDVDDPEYPSEWIRPVGGSPRCTAFTASPETHLGVLRELREEIDGTNHDDHDAEQIAQIAAVEFAEEIIRATAPTHAATEPAASGEGLLPCPHCGARAELRGGPDCGWFIACPTDDCCNANRAIWSESDLIASWNRRLSGQGSDHIADAGKKGDVP